MKYELNINIPTLEAAPEVYAVIIYQLLRQCSNVNHKLSMEDIIDTFSAYWQGDKSKPSYRKNIQRPIKRNLKYLMEMDSNIKAVKKGGEPFNIDDDESIFRIKEIWYEQALSHTDVQLLTDAVISAKHFDNKKRRELLRKLLRTIGETGTTQKPWFENVLSDAEDITVPTSTDLYKNLEIINEAIANKKCLSFDYCFSGPRGEKYKVRSYASVSPYKILYNNGKYYLAISRRIEEPLERGVKIDPKMILTVEIHKMDNIKPYEAKYLPLEKTEGKNLKADGFLNSSKLPFGTGRVMFFLSEYNDKALLQANAEGLDILIERYGNRITAYKIKEIKPRIEGTAPELRNLYKVELRAAPGSMEIGRVEWDELAMLCIKHPFVIKLIEPQGLIDGMIYNLERIQKGGPDYWEP